jgi:hypothetical protein
MTRALVIVLVLAGSATPAVAWDGPELWYGSATGDSPGGGGILGTGGMHDHGIKCSHCHVERKLTDLAFGLEFQPALPSVSGEASYVPGQRYTITARMTNESLGTPCSDPYGKNVDNFAAAFENEEGAAVGVLESDTGAIATSCPTTTPAPDSAGTTAITGDCEVVFSKGKANTTTWSFAWTAPTAGPVIVSWGAVDGDCLMMSMDDAVVEGKTLLRAPATAGVPSRTPWHVAIASVVLFGLVIVPWRRRRDR